MDRSKRTDSHPGLVNPPVCWSMESRFVPLSLGLFGPGAPSLKHSTKDSSRKHQGENKEEKSKHYQKQNRDKSPIKSSSKKSSLNPVSKHSETPHADMGMAGAHKESDIGSSVPKARGLMAPVY